MLRFAITPHRLVCPGIFAPGSSIFFSSCFIFFCLRIQSFRFPTRSFPSFRGPVTTDAGWHRATHYPEAVVSKVDKGCPVTFLSTIHINPKSTKDEIQRFCEFVRAADLRSSPNRELWAYYQKKMVEVDYILRLNLLDPTRLETTELDKLWMDAEPFRPILVVMLLHGHLQVEDSHMLVEYFGNL